VDDLVPAAFAVRGRYSLVGVDDSDKAAFGTTPFLVRFRTHCKKMLEALHIFGNATASNCGTEFG